MAEERVALSIRELIQLALRELPDAGRIQLGLPDQGPDETVWVPRESFAQALRGLLHNALDATPHGEPVGLSVARQEANWQITVRDQGPGMSPEVLARAGEPFFTTKQPGQGMGLGLFLTRSVVERLGGTLRLESGPGQGVTAIVELPRRA